MTERVQGIFQVQNTAFSWRGQRAEAGESLSLCCLARKTGLGDWFTRLRSRAEYNLPGFLFPDWPTDGELRGRCNAPRPVFSIKSMILDRERPLLGSSWPAVHALMQ